MKPILSLSVLITSSLILAIPAQAATGEGATLLRAIDSQQAEQNFRLSDSERLVYNQEMAATEVCVAQARKAYKKSKKRAANKAMRRRWEVMLRFAVETSKEGQVFAAMEEELLGWAANLEQLQVDNEDLKMIKTNGPALLRQNLTLEKRFGAGWGCRLTKLLIKSNKPLATRQGGPTREGARVFYRSIGMSEKNYLKDTDEILRLADDNSNLNTILEEDYQASESEMAWYQALLTEQMGLLRYVRTD